METATIYLVYSDDGALLRYAGQDEAAYDAACAELAPAYAGSLVGRRAVGPTEQWIVRSYFRAEPSPAFIAARRGSFRFRLDWEGGQAISEQQ